MTNRFEAAIEIWRCVHCGQLVFADGELPRRCQCCGQQQSWQTMTHQIIRWRCLNCGQIRFDDRDSHPPGHCDYCQDMTTWQSLN